ncbi:DivIVA domain-containing protein [Acidipropionibacterium jensenii]|uniref:DivIVA domain-containing protein n=1 Tax=Acidipropionibacterium jensenii TaxID=1749 RepID=UPI000BEF1768|nr:DivIVA domain-containing protein [Acidipropionibacterium jensenii]AZZ41824.1 DivIVA domain-containing protein [Acidipropionibacterium jensenii]
MTLTLDEVRRIRFPMARRPGEGYRAGEVDDFVDKVDATFAAIIDENDRLKAQMDALKTADGATAQPDPRLGEENEHLKAQLEELRTQKQNAEQKLQGAEQANAGLKAQLEELQRAAQQSGGEAAANAELARLRSENQDLQNKLQAAQQAAAAPAPAPLAQPSGSTEGQVRPEHIVVTTSAQASPAVVRMVELAIADAERVVHEAQEEAHRKTSDAEKKAHEHIVDAQTRAERIESAARVNADRMVSEAKQNAEQVTTDAKARRNDLFTKLEKERDELAGKVDQLRTFESGYRQNLVNQLRGQAESIEKGVFEPTETADLVRSENRVAPGTSATPRLDALITGRSQQN